MEGLGPAVRVDAQERVLAGGLVVVDDQVGALVASDDEALAPRLDGAPVVRPGPEGQPHRPGSPPLLLGAGRLFDDRAPSHLLVDPARGTGVAGDAPGADRC